MSKYLQVGPSCDLDENGDPKPPKYIKVDRWYGGPDDPKLPKNEEFDKGLRRVLRRLGYKRKKA